MRCEQCGTRLDGPPFDYRGHSLCCECMSAFCSWLLDGGMAEDPDLFAWLVT